MNQQQLGWKGHREALTFDFAWAYLVSMAAALAGLFLPFAQQQYGCPHDAACLLIAALSQPSLVGGQAGPALLGVVSGALLLALFSLVRPQRPLFLVGLALSLTTLALVSFDAATAGSWIFKLQDPFPVTSEAGFYLATIGCSSASLMALLLLVVGDSFHPGKLQRKTLVACAYPVFMTICLVGLLVPFVQQGCPAPRCIAGKLALPNDLLAQSQQGLALLALVLAGLLVGGVTIRRLSTPILLVQLALPVATLAVICLDAADPWVRVLQLPPDFLSVLLVLAPGFYLAIIGSAGSLLIALLLLVDGRWHPRRATGLSVRGAAA
ncbi:MAG: hypothetical protein WB802_03160 [Candidatus Dormiibacterota bacterium]|jgi:hypothetical protein